MIRNTACVVPVSFPKDSFTNLQGPTVVYKIVTRDALCNVWLRAHRHLWQVAESRHLCARAGEIALQRCARSGPLLQATVSPKEVYHYSRIWEILPIEKWIRSQWHGQTKSQCTVSLGWQLPTSCLASRDGSHLG
jgi:hypothetical protein